jgi:hypothetical protein
MLNDVEPQRLRADSVKQIKSSLPAGRSSPIEPLPAKLRSNYTGPSNDHGSRNASQSIKSVPVELEDTLGLSEPEKAELANRNTADFEDLLNEMSKPLSGSRSDAMGSTNWLDEGFTNVSISSKPTAQPLRQSRIDQFDKWEHDESSPSIIRTAGIGPPPDIAPPAVETIEMQAPRPKTPDGFDEAVRNMSKSPKKPYDRDSKIDAMASTAWLHDEFEDFDISSVKTKSTPKANRGRAVWCETQWTNLSFQAKKLGMPKLPYFDPKTMLLSKEVNYKMWKQLLKLYDFLGPEKAPLATPMMLEGGEVEWHSFLDEDRGIKAEIYDVRTPRDTPPPLPSFSAFQPCLG